MFEAKAAAVTMGAAIATATNASDRSQPPNPKLSTSMFSIAQPASSPAISALPAIR